MTRKSVVPQANEYSSRDFQTSTARVKRAREELLKDNRASEAYRRLGEDVIKHLERKQATLAQVRRAVGMTQAQLAETLGLAQGDVSRIEQRTNLQLSTLARFIEATGGHLQIIAVYGKRKIPLKIGDISPAALDVK